MTVKCLAFGASCFVLLALLAPLRPSAPVGHVLSGPEMASVAGDAEASFCVRTFRCRDGIVDRTDPAAPVCAFCESDEKRKVCCEVKKDGGKCAHTGPAACKGGRRMASKSFLAASCGSCTATHFMEDGRCEKYKHAVGDKKCKE